jgi:hypothetical protein
MVIVVMSDDVLFVVDVLTIVMFLLFLYNGYHCHVFFLLIFFLQWSL